MSDTNASNPVGAELSYYERHGGGLLFEISRDFVSPTNLKEIPGFLITTNEGFIYIVNFDGIRATHSENKILRKEIQKLNEQHINTCAIFSVLLLFVLFVGWMFGKATGYRKYRKQMEEKNSEIHDSFKSELRTTKADAFAESPQSSVMSFGLADQLRAKAASIREGGGE